MTQKRLQYFASADGAIEHRTDPADFESSLIYNILFEDSALVMPDAFFFNSTTLAQHVKRFHDIDGNPAQIPFFLRALSLGLVIPAFRSASTTSFSEGYADMRGLNIRQIEERERGLARWLDEFYGRLTDRGDPVLWADNLGGSYEDLFVKILQPKEPAAGIEDDDIRSLWRDTEKWRAYCVEDAKRLTASLGGTGVRRAEIWNAIGRREGVLAAGETFDDPGDFVGQMKTYRPEKGRAAQFIVDLTNICYHQNQARGMRRGTVTCQPNIPRSLSRSAQAVVPALTKARIPRRLDTEFVHYIKLPTIEAIQNAGSSELIAIRNGDPGDAYRTHRSRWVSDPSSDNGKLLRIASDAYAAAIREAARGDRETIKILITPRRIATDAAAGLAGYAAGDLLHPHYTLFGIFSALTGAIATDAASVIVQGASRRTRRDFEVRVASYPGIAEFNL